MYKNEIVGETYGEISREGTFKLTVAEQRMNMEIEETTSKKLRVAVLFGGCSTEYDVSLQSSYAVITKLNKERYEIIQIGITPQGDWFRFFGSPEQIANDTWRKSGQCISAIISPDRNTHGLVEFHQDRVIVTEIDIVFPVLHGKNGEDGTIQGLLEMAGIPFVGCNTLSSAICMDKDVAHQLVALKGIRIPESVIISQRILEDELMFLTKELNYPLFVKPVKAGSSLGITKVIDKDELFTATLTAFEYDNKIIIEECIEGFEVGCAVLGNQELIVGKVDEIELSQGFFDYTEKYTLKTSNIHMPARVDEATEKRIRETAITIYQGLHCTGFARVDMFLTPEHEIVFNEVNTIPGFTSHSRYPSMLNGIGMTYEEILDALIRMAMEI